MDGIVFKTRAGRMTAFIQLPLARQLHVTRHPHDGAAAQHGPSRTTTLTLAVLTMSSSTQNTAPASHGDDHPEVDDDESTEEDVNRLWPSKEGQCAARD